MVLAVLALAAAALCYGGANVVQAAAVARASGPGQTGLLGGLARDPRYAGGLALVAAGFLLTLVAVRALPLFVVQAGRASSLGITAVLAAATLGSRLRRHEVAALVGVGAGLVAVALSAAPQGPADVPTAVRWAVLAGAGVLLVLALAGARSDVSAGSGAALAVLAGCGFGVLSLGARVLGPIAVPGVLADPSAYAIGVGGLTGLVAGALAMQRSSVVTVSTTVVATEAVVGSLLGVAVGDRPADGMAGLAVAGFVVTVGSALLLARFGAPAAAVPDPALADRD
jgi:hypothetical protein